MIPFVFLFIGAVITLFIAESLLNSLQLKRDGICRVCLQPTKKEVKK